MVAYERSYATDGVLNTFQCDRNAIHKELINISSKIYFHENTDASYELIEMKLE